MIAFPCVHIVYVCACACVYATMRACVRKCVCMSEFVSNVCMSYACMNRCMSVCTGVYLCMLCLPVWLQACAILYALQQSYLTQNTVKCNH